MSEADCVVVCDCFGLANKQRKPGTQGVLPTQLLELFFLAEEISVISTHKRLHKFVYISQMIKNG